MSRIFLAALALACVCSPAMAFGALPAPTGTGSFLAALGGGICLGVALASALPMRARLPISAFGLFIALTGASLAAEVAAVGATAVILPWGDYLVATAQMAVQIMLPVILPVLAAAVIAALAKVAPWATLFLSQRRLEQMGQALADYGLNAVQGAATGKTLSVDVGSRVIAAGVNYGLQKVPPKVVEAAGGAEGLAKIIFRLISFDERATASAVIPAAMEKLHLPPAVIEHHVVERPTGSGFPPPTADELRDAERMSRG